MFEALEAQKRDIEDMVFRHPPANWEEFQMRKGTWLGLNKAQELLHAELERIRQEEEDDNG